MSANNPLRLAGILHRRHTLNKEQVDSNPWQHPRPPADPRLVWLHLALIWTAAGQAIFGPPQNTVQAKGFGWAATIVYGIVLILFCVMYLVAAKCKSQYESWGWEIGASVGFAGCFAIYAWVLIQTTPEWQITYTWSFIVGLAVGNARRAWILIRRLW